MIEVESAVVKWSNQGERECNVIDIWEIYSQMNIQIASRYN